MHLLALSSTACPHTRQEVHEVLHSHDVKPVIQNRALWKTEPERVLPGGRYPLNLIYDEDPDYIVDRIPAADLSCHKSAPVLFEVEHLSRSDPESFPENLGDGHLSPLGYGSFHTAIV